MFIYRDTMMKVKKQKLNRHYKAPLHIMQQQGFVLVLVLVMLAVLTLIGVSSMNSSSIELKATANARQHHIAFNAVQSLLEFAVSGQDTVTVDFQTTSSTVQTVAYPDAAPGLTASELSASVVYAGCAPSPGSSLEEGKGFSSNFFDITGTGSNATGTASSTQVQGIRFPAAACN